MATDTKTIHVFLASPGDVGEERAFVRDYLETKLPNDPLLSTPVNFEVVCWDHPAAPVPMPFSGTPQQAVDRFKRRPADCDIVIVILASRMGTHLDTEAHPRPGGGRYLSGTEWEFENARESPRKPEIFIYRRTDIPRIDPMDDDAEDKLRQTRLVRQFCEQFKNPDGSWKNGFDTYTGVAAFEVKFESCVKHLLRERFGVAQRQMPPDAPLASIPFPDRCIGRDLDTTTVVDALTAAGPRIAVLIQGQGGIGKTTLTQQAALHDQVVARFGERRWFVELETATDRDTFDAAIFRALGLDATQGFDAVLRRLAQERALLVLDNFETPWSGDQVAIEQRLARFAAIPGLALLVSFRGDDPVGGARWSLRYTVHPLTDANARDLFLDIAESIRGDDPRLAELLAALGGVPLAICLTARRATRHDNLAELWAEWQSAGTAVAQLPGAAQSRRTSVPRSIEFSLLSPRLGEPGRRLFRLLGQLPAGIADQDRRTLLGADAFIAAEQVRGVGLAYIRSDRLDLLPPVRDHARRAYPPEAADTAWIQHYLSLAKRADRMDFSDGEDAVLPWLLPELPNVDAAIDAAIADGNPTQAALVATGLSKALRFSGLGSQRALTSLAAACGSAGEYLFQALCLEGLGDIALDRSDYDAARSRYEEALPLYRRVDNVLGEANCIWRLGDIARLRSDHEAARSRYEEALPLYQRLNNVHGEANCIYNLGDIALARSDHDAARSRYQDALPLYRRVGHVLGEANCVRGLGEIALAHSDHDAARSRHEEALPLYRRVGDVRGEANCIKSLGDIALARSDHDAARLCFEKALPLYRRVGDVLGEANCIRSLGDIALARSEHDAAQSRYEEALPLFRRVGQAHGEANCIQSLGHTAFARSDHEAARSRYEEALPLFRRVGDQLGEATCIWRLGDIALDRSDYETARSRYEEALPLYRRVGNAHGEANCVLGAGRVAETAGDRETAQERYAAALAAYVRIHRMDNVAVAHEHLADVTDGAEREAHINAAKETWLAINLPDQAARVVARFR